jgi:hypothetical protein
MATVSPAFDFVTAQAAKVPRVTWADIVTGDTITAFPVAAQAAVAGAVQFGGTFGGATVGLQVSNDGTTYFDMKDLAGTTISATAIAHPTTAATQRGNAWRVNSCSELAFGNIDASSM